MHEQVIYISSALLCALAATVPDLRSRRIPNLLTGPAIASGLLLHLLLGGLPSLGLSLLAGSLAGGLFLLFFIAGGMGAGDVKLMTAVGCLAGTAYLKETLIATVLIGAVMGIAFSIYRGQLQQTLVNVVALARHHSEKGFDEHAELNVRNPKTLRLPYALPIAVGCLFTLVLALSKDMAR